MPSLGDFNPTATNSAEDIADMVRSSSTKKYKRVLLVGRPKAGKTQCAATLAKEHPAKILTKPLAKVLKLKSAIWLNADAGGLDTLDGLNMEVDEIPLYEILDPKEKPETQILPILEHVRDLVVSGKKQLVVLDSVSELDAAIVQYYAKVAQLTTRSDKRDSFGIWRGCKDDHRWIHAALNRLPCDIVYISHVKKEGETSQKKAKADALPGDHSDVVIAADYQDVANIYRRQNSLICSVQVEVDMMTKEKTRWLYTQPHNGVEAGTRYEAVLDLQEEPHLGKLFKKVAGK